MSKRIVHVGGHGLGSSLKMVNNLLAAVAMAAFAEGQRSVKRLAFRVRRSSTR